MKTYPEKTILALACAAALSVVSAYAQDSVTTTSTVTSDGVVTQFEPAASQFIVTSTGTTAPVRYTYNKTTTFVDAAGNVVSQESIKQNTPARIYYTKVGDTYVVTKFVANPTVETKIVTPVLATPAPVIEETTTTTTTTGKEE